MYLSDLPCLLALGLACLRALEQMAFSVCLCVSMQDLCVSMRVSMRVYARPASASSSSLQMTTHLQALPRSAGDAFQGLQVDGIPSIRFSSVTNSALRGLGVNRSRCV